MSTFIKTGKDKIKKEDHSNVVYKINCQDCNYSYVGQTKRKLKTRLKKHIKDFNKPTTSLSVISYYKLGSDHTIDWENPCILDAERFYYKRMVSEVIHIKRQEKGLNKQSDTERFPKIYLPLIGNYRVGHLLVRF